MKSGIFCGTIDRLAQAVALQLTTTVVLIVVLLVQLMSIIKNRRQPEAPHAINHDIRSAPGVGSWVRCADD